MCYFFIIFACFPLFLPFSAFGVFLFLGQNIQSAARNRQNPKKYERPNRKRYTMKEDKFRGGGCSKTMKEKERTQGQRTHHPEWGRHSRATRLLEIPTVKLFGEICSHSGPEEARMTLKKSQFCIPFPWHCRNLFCSCWSHTCLQWEHFLAWAKAPQPKKGRKQWRIWASVCQSFGCGLCGLCTSQAKLPLSLT